ncbi:NADH-ubiquinone oxidoreductase chain 5 [Phtheirospermum japonicum]|uniref:NADH-ubiquinone oxidoreductase chain 5 n=1 Tax=Phtheirospermum japonicum TaxID=374723 RepID=A0A830D1K6_9LAMI|nr:NADH-ubiquinone oxidoreductase chain 5 [Phtheirospermum japonicum]
MIFACGISNYSVSVFHLMNHAFLKALLFLSIRFFARKKLKGEFPQNSICFYEINYGILFTHFKLSICFPPFPMSI